MKNLKLEELKIKVKALEDRLRNLETRIRGIERGFPSSALIAFVDEDSCIGCGICRDVCAAGAISVEEVAEVDPKRCTGCGQCVAQCPEGALTLHPSTSIPWDKASLCK
jgi:ferredoxin